MTTTNYAGKAYYPVATIISYLIMHLRLIFIFLPPSIELMLSIKIVDFKMMVC